MDNSKSSPAERQKFIHIRGAKTHNLDNVEVKIPRDAMTVITGLSGSGKSSLAFDTLYAEGQRRYVESMSAYARQFLSVSKPDVDSIEGLSPAIAIEQKSTSHNPRSTVGTVTEIQDYLRLLFARVGIPYCPTHMLPLKASSITQIIRQLFDEQNGDKAIVMAPLVDQKKGTHKDLIQMLLARGFLRARLNGEMIDLADIPELDKNKRHTIELVVDRLRLNEDNRQRISESIETSIIQSGSLVKILLPDHKKELLFSTTHSCRQCGYSLSILEPKMFSFNNPAGACEGCQGLGKKRVVSLQKILVNEAYSIEEGALSGWGKINGWFYQVLAGFCKFKEISTQTPWKDLSPAEQKLILKGSSESFAMKFKTATGRTYSRNKPFRGVLRSVERRYHETESSKIRDELIKFFSEENCQTCEGTRLNEAARHVFLEGTKLSEISELSIEQALAFFHSLDLQGNAAEVAEQITNEIYSRLSFLNDVGLGYLSLSRSAHTLSGGEAQRIRLASQIGTGLVGVMYILDEPSIGLHQRDNSRLLETLRRLRNLGNAVIVVEHDEEAIMAADHLIDMGPRAGVHGGKICAQGTPQEVMENPNSITGQFLSGKQAISVPSKRRKAKGALEVKGASGNNLQDVNLSLPLGVFNCITGVSGSGKSSLINHTLYPACANALNRASMPVGPHKSIEGLDKLDKVIEIDQSPIGRTPRSNPATYTGLFSPIRDLFSSTLEARSRGYKPGRFSFNVKGGRCEHCQGDGVIKVEMHFLADVYVTCEECKGDRYNKQTLEILYKGKNISEVLAMTVEDAEEFFKAIPQIARILNTLMQVGLGYIRLGQAATTLSGGEAQRIKLSKELAKRATGRTLYLLDEPTTGLHFQDIQMLLKVLHSLVDSGNTVTVIEHNLDFIKTADWIVDIGPEGGNGGGMIIAQGTPEKVAKVKGSFTGSYLGPLLKAKSKAKGA